MWPTKTILYHVTKHLRSLLKGNACLAGEGRVTWPCPASAAWGRLRGRARTQLHWLALFAHLEQRTAALWGEDSLTGEGYPERRWLVGNSTSERHMLPATPCFQEHGKQSAPDQRAHGVSRCCLWATGSSGSRGRCAAQRAHMPWVWNTAVTRLLTGDGTEQLRPAPCPLTCSGCQWGPARRWAGWPGAPPCPGNSQAHTLERASAL